MNKKLPVLRRKIARPCASTSGVGVGCIWQLNSQQKGQPSWYTAPTNFGTGPLCALAAPALMSATAMVDNAKAVDRRNRTDPRCCLCCIAVLEVTHLRRPEPLKCCTPPLPPVSVENAYAVWKVETGSEDFRRLRLTINEANPPHRASSISRTDSARRIGDETD